MAYGNTGSNSNKGSYSKPAYGSNSKPAAASSSSKKEEYVDKALMRKFIRTSKSGNSIGFVVGDQPLTIPANTRVVITVLSDKRKAALEATGKTKGFKGVTPTHELAVLPMDQQQS